MTPGPAGPRPTHPQPARPTTPRPTPLPPTRPSKVPAARGWRAELAYQVQYAAYTAAILAGLELLSISATGGIR